MQTIMPLFRGNSEMLSCFTFRFAVSLAFAAGTAFHDCDNASCGDDQLKSVQSCSDCGELPACTICSTGCNVCQLPECGVCGQNQCWDCSADEGIDLASFTPEALSQKLYEASMARIIIILPEDAGVSLLDQKMSTLGSKRSFVVSVFDQSKAYKYEIKVDVVVNGKKYFKKLKITELRAGMILTVAVEAPPVPEDEPAQIMFTPEMVHPGGKPQ